MRQAGGCPAVWARDATGIQEANFAESLVARHVGVAVQHNIYVCRQSRWRNVDQAEADAVALQVDADRPIHIAVAITPHDHDRRADYPQCLQQMWRADVAEVPDLIRAFSEPLWVRRQMVVRVSEDENAERHQLSCEEMRLTAAR